MTKNGHLTQTTTMAAGVGGGKTRTKRSHHRDGGTDGRRKEKRDGGGDGGGVVAADERFVIDEQEDRIDGALLSRAVHALIKHHRASSKNKKPDLLDSNEGVTVQFGLTIVPPYRSESKPYRIDVPRPLHRLRGSEEDDGAEEEEEDDGLDEVEVCLICKESTKPQMQEMISHFPNHLGSIRKVLGLDSLRKKYQRYEQRRDLLHRFDFFLCDDRILPMVGRCLGKNFYAAKKQPVPIDVTRKTALPFVVQRAVRGSTYFWMPSGTCAGVRVGHTGMPEEHLAANCKAVVPQVVSKIPGRWRNVHSISVKTTHSVSLPFYNRTPEELLALARDSAGDEEGPTDGSSGKESDGGTERRGGSAKKRSRERDGQEGTKDSEENATETNQVGSSRITNEKDEEDRHKEKTRKKSKTKESPLLSALKRQKSVEEAAADASAQSRGSDGVSTKDRKTKKVKTSTQGVGSKIPEDASESKPKTGQDTEKDTFAEEQVVTPKHSDKQKPSRKDGRGESESADAEQRSRPKTDKEDGSGVKKEFIRSKKFKGSRKGYVFKSGDQGLGYYVDVVPTVDKVAFAMMIRDLKASKKKKGDGAISGGGGHSRKKRRKGRR